MVQGDSDYKRKMARWRELTLASQRRKLTVAEEAELRQVDKLLERAELTAQRSPIAVIADDYAEMLAREAGNVDGVEW